MARLCIQIAPNDHPTDPSLNAVRYQPGDVVCIVDDGHVFTHAEMTNGQYRIIDVPGVQAEQLQSLCESVNGSGTMLKRRAISLDITTLRSAQWRNRTSVTKEQIDLITVART